MTPVREAAVVRAITAWLRTLPRCCYRVNHGTGYGVAGEPDIIGCIDGRMFALEAKRPGAGPTPIQVARMAQWTAAGAVVGVAHSRQEAQDILAEVTP